MAGMQGGEELGAVGPVARGMVEGPTGPGSPRTATERTGGNTATAASGAVAGPSAFSGAAQTGSADQVALSSGLSAADAQVQAQRAAELLKIVGPSAPPVNLHDLARVLEREGVILP